MNALIVSDIHLGVNRASGATVQTRRELQQYLQTWLREFIAQHTDKDLVLLGDIFDTFNVDPSQLLECYVTIADWLKDSGRTVHAVLGNHDLAKNSEKTSSFDFLGTLLTRLYPDQVRVYKDGFAEVYSKVYVISHVHNQDLFDLELEKALHVAPGYLLLHANCDNHFAEQSDHSLNVSAEWLEKLVKHGHVVCHAHEHQGKTLRGGKVVVFGNQVPSSVSDCMAHGDAQKDGKKYAHILDDTGLHKVETWSAEGDYLQIDWRHLHGEMTCGEPTIPFRFIRVTGTATTEEASSVISAISRFRQDSNALVISNSVRIAGIDGLDELSTLSAERLASVDVMAALCEELTPEEIVVVKCLLED